eukprot:666889-Pelagomonas_calceolata.AAC.1
MGCGAEVPNLAISGGSVAGSFFEPPWDGKLYLAIRDDLSAPTTLPSPNANPKTWQNNTSAAMFISIIIINQPISKPHYQRGCATHARGGGEQAQSLGSSMTPPKRAKEHGLDNVLVHPVQAE